LIKKEYIRGIIALYKYGEVSMDNLEAVLGIHKHFVQFILAAHGIRIYSLMGRGSFKENKNEDFAKRMEKIEENRGKIIVTKETIKDTESNSEDEAEEEEENSDEENDFDEFEEYPQEFQSVPNPSTLFQTPEDNDPNYWEKWNEMTKHE
uniref:Uncharacterized protein n=1 Tax=Meloidogyne floridensis TaxID=298350 RepID=A0A915NDR6_9BILA